MKRKYQKLKRKSVQSLYSDFVTKLKSTNPGKWYQMAKQIGAVSQIEQDDPYQIPCLEGLDDLQSAEKIADFYAATSNEYQPVDLCKLPAYLPSPSR